MSPIQSPCCVVPERWLQPQSAVPRWVGLGGASSPPASCGDHVDTERSLAKRLGAGGHIASSWSVMLSQSWAHIPVYCPKKLIVLLKKIFKPKPTQWHNVSVQEIKYKKSRILFKWWPVWLYDKERSKKTWAIIKDIYSQLFLHLFQHDFHLQTYFISTLCNSISPHCVLQNSRALGGADKPFLSLEAATFRYLGKN